MFEVAFHGLGVPAQIIACSGLLVAVGGYASIELGARDVAQLLKGSNNSTSVELNDKRMQRSVTQMTWLQ